ncbi:MAG: ABC transporter permease, partial [Clostridia bacterium]|nr:ABC transporter permease [Clostridia bacterium]
LIPWFFFQEALNGATAALVEYNYLVKKVVFNVSFLPVLKVCSALVVHVFFIAVFFIVGMVYGYYPGLTHLQLFYYILCTSFLVVGLGYITSAISVFFRDMMQIVNILLTIGTWATPILWNLDATVNGWLQIVFKLNPIYYIVSGFRDALLDKVWFWEKPVWTLYFWCVSVVVYLVGVKLFNRLKVHFSDVL